MVAVFPQHRLATAEQLARRFGGLLVLLDARRITGVAEGGSVNTWPDISGNGKNFVKATGTLTTAPVFRFAGLNGRPSVEFNGTTDIMSSAAAVLTGNEWTIYLVHSFAAAASDVAICQHNGLAASGRTTLGCGVTTPAVLRTFYNDGTSSRNVEGTSTGFDATPRLAGWFNDAAGNSNVGIAGGPIEGAMGPFPYTPLNAVMDLGGLLDESVGNAAGANHCTGQCSHVMVANRRWTREQCDLYERAICREFGLKYR